MDYNTGMPAVSKLDEPSLQQIAGDLGVSYGTHSSSAAVNESAKIAHDAWEQAPSSIYEAKVTGRLEGYHILAIPLALGLAIWVIIAARQRGLVSQELWEARNRKEAMNGNRFANAKKGGTQNGHWHR